MKGCAILSTREEDKLIDLDSKSKKEQIYEAIEKFDLKDKKLNICFSLIYNKDKEKELFRVIHIRQVGNYYGI